MPKKNFNSDSHPNPLASLADSQRSVRTEGEVKKPAKSKDEEQRGKEFIGTKEDSGNSAPPQHPDAWEMRKQFGDLDAIRAAKRKKKAEESY